ncbi:amino acid adenylation domain-containing protein [Bacillus cereus]|uniref:amino acid adenylation domain-containing protein n=1 Tax=Bacillus cereus TaxID=1396 RepID=UPI0024BC4429|nr:amino acid adenylation domain-containing protein [Bacillus cereus]WHT91495.1 amino acid adenylation domain-containing protein [Bacillus cereus]
MGKIPLTSAQRGIWYAQKLQKNNNVFNTAEYVEINGKVNVNFLKDSIKQTILECEALNSNLYERDDELYQTINEKKEIIIDYHDLSGNNDAHNLAINWMKEEMELEINLSNDQLYREMIFRIDDNKYYWYQKIHHAIIDGYGVSLILKKVSDIYTSKLTNVCIDNVSFGSISSIIEEENNYYTSDKYLQDSKYWISKMKYHPEVVSFNNHQQMNRDTYKSKIQFIRETRYLSTCTIKKLEDLAHSLKVNWSEILLSATAIYLSLTTGQNKITLGLPMMCRLGSVSLTIPSNVMNVLPLIVNVESNNSINNLIMQVSKEILEIKKHEKYRSELIRRELGYVGTNDKLFGPVVNFKTFDYSLNFGGVKGIVHNLSAGPVEDISINIYIDVETSTIKVEMDANPRQYSENDISLHIDRLINIIDNLLDTGIDSDVGSIDILLEKERLDILNNFNRSESHILKFQTIHGMFEYQVEKKPNNIAIQSGDTKITYKELNIKANQIGKELQKKGVLPGDIVGLGFERSIEMLASILGILKVGAIYLPIDPKYPAERISLILNDSGASFLLTDHSIKDKISFQGVKISLDNIYLGEVNNLNSDVKTTDIAYIIYTSGTTGKPNGVMIEHKSVINFLQTLEERSPLKDTDSLLLKTTISFDASVWELFWWMWKGARLSLLENHAEMDPLLIIEAINKYKITHLEFSPSMLQVFLNYVNEFKMQGKLVTVKYVSVGGEVLSANLTRCFYDTLTLKNNTRLYNTYGPTETTVEVSSYLTQGNETSSIPIGKPNINTKFYIFSDSFKLQPIGVTGNLYIAGEGLARGYLNRADLTKEKFVENPIVPGEKIYYTGDLARWLVDGNVEYMGRVDNQVKVRGFRIEVEEIENALYKTGLIQQAVIIPTKAEKESLELITYYVTNKSVTTEKIKEKLSEILPSYMIPSYFFELKDIPLTINGKIDYKSLPKYIHKSKKDFEERPLTQLENELAIVWSAVLGINKPSLLDNFFDFGGHSLKAVSLVTKIHDTFQVKLSIKDVFDNPVFNQLAKQIEGKRKEEHLIIPQISTKNSYVISPLQKRMFEMHKISPSKIAYNMPSVTEFKGSLNVKRLENAISYLIERHETLRTYFLEISSEIRQKIASFYSFKLNVIEMDDQKEIANYINNFVQPFNLNKLPLFKCELLKVGEDSYLFLLDMHHIISDGISLNIFMNDLIKYYNGESLPPLRVQYKDYANWQLSRSKGIEKQGDYWRDLFKGQFSMLKLPTDYETQQELDFKGSNIEFVINRSQKEKLYLIAKEKNTTLYTVMLTIYTIMLSTYSKNNDIIIGSMSGGRTHSDLECTMGLFVNNVAVRNQPLDHKLFYDFLEEVKENALKAIENQEYPFDKVLNNYQKNINLNNEILESMFLFQKVIKLNNFKGDLEINSFNMIEQPVSDFKLILEIIDNDIELKCILTYSTTLYKYRTIKELGDNMLNIIEHIINNPGDTILKIKEKSVINVDK